MALYARSTQTNLSAREVALRSSHGHHSIGGGTFRFAIDIDLGQSINRTPERVAAASLAWCSLNHVATPVVIVCVAVSGVIIVVVRIVAAEAKSEAASEVAVMAKATVMVEPATMKSTAAETAITKCHAAMVAAGEATMEAAAAKAAAVETAASP